eukprot:CAMPEP_0117670812 /NCGR_PEP_ID=MMETSP0804-20121206/12978_1 /TAXON_ID=1074897 /ORGANISM="Tetraselmis astigmatica, Strain CCMP880" /LENGTH=389 /DNA_ID=CAMNT_0005479187 /DNA_START=119 /DNA_END=1289 /DNA_ORIENTATION=+
MAEPNAQDKLNMSLDDLLSSRKSQPRESRGGDSGRHSRGGGRGRGKRSYEYREDEPVGATTIKVARRIYVSNLSYRTAWQGLKDHFKAVGDVTRADVLTDPATGRSKGCGIVEFATSQEAARAIQELDESMLDERTIYIREDREDPDLKEHLEESGDRPRAKSPLLGSYGMGGRGGGRGGGVGGPAVVGRRLYVQNLSFETDWRMLKDHFRQAGDVVHADVLEDQSGRSKGCGIVEYRSPHDALRAMQLLSNTDLDGRPLHIREDREEAKAGGFAFGGAGGYSQGPGAFYGGAGRGAPRRPPPPSEPGCQVVVHGIPYEFSWQDLKDFLKPAGHVVHTDIEVDATGRSKGYGVGVFSTPSHAQHAISTLHGSDLNGRIITVKLDKFARG